MDNRSLIRRVLGWPATPPGRWAMRLAGVFLAALLVFLLTSARGETGGDAFFDNLRLAIPVLVALLAGLGCGFAAAIAILRHRERSLLAALPLALGAFVAWFTVAVVLFPD